RVAGAAAAPRPKARLVVAPREFFELWTQRAVGEIGKVPEGMIGEIAPGELADEGQHAAPAALVVERTGARRVPELAWPDLAPMKMRRKPGSAGLGRPVAGL